VAAGLLHWRHRGDHRLAATSAVTGTNLTVDSPLRRARAKRCYPMEHRCNNMRLVLFLCLMALTALAADDNGWQSLFDGKSSAGWVEVTGKPFPPNSWTVEDGCLKTLVRPGGAQDIRTVESFRSFDLQFDWKVLANGNSGVKYLIQHIDEWTNQLGRQARARGLEYQLADNAGPDAVEPIRSAASLYSAIAPSPKSQPAVGSFNHSRIIVKGDHVEHWLNGVRVVSFDLSEPEAQKVFAGLRKKDEDASTPIQRATPISLQNHGTEAWFKNLKIRKLD
jgi:hypothetical protein